MSELKRIQIELRAAKHNTFTFILLTIVTGGFYGMHWTMNFEKILQNDEKEIVPHYIFLVIAALTFFICSFFINMTPTYLLVLIISIVLIIYINIKIYNRAQVVITQAGSDYKMNKIIAALFGAWYFYYAIRRANLVPLQDAKAAD